MRARFGGLLALCLLSTFLETLHGVQQLASTAAAGDERQAGLKMAAEETLGFSCWKLCGMYYKYVKGEKTMTAAQQQTCCRRVSLFETKRQQDTFLSVAELTREPPSAVPVSTVVHAQPDAVASNEDPETAYKIMAVAEKRQHDREMEIEEFARKMNGPAVDVLVSGAEDGHPLFALQPPPQTAPPQPQATVFDNDNRMSAVNAVFDSRMPIQKFEQPSQPTGSTGKAESPATVAAVEIAPGAGMNSPEHDLDRPEPSLQSSLQPPPPTSPPEPEQAGIPDAPVDTGGPKTILIAIPTSPNHIDERMAIRNTYKQMLNPSNILFLTSEAQRETDLKFFIGNFEDRPDADPPFVAKQWELRIEQEAKEYKDIVRLADLQESYANLTLKSVLMQKYALQHNFRSIFKTDDDSFVRIDRLWTFLDRYHHIEDMFAAHCSWDFPVNEDPSSKNYMRDTFKGESIPILCHGGGYLLGSKLMNYILTNWDLGKLVAHRNEDMAMSLWLEDPTSDSPPHFLMPEMDVTFFWDECNSESVYMNPMRPEDMKTVWANVNEINNNPCNHDFQLQEFLNMIDALAQQEAEDAALAAVLPGMMQPGR